MSPAGYRDRPASAAPATTTGTPASSGARAFHNEPFFEFLLPRPLQRGAWAFRCSAAVVCGRSSAMQGTCSGTPAGRAARRRGGLGEAGALSDPIPAQLRMLGKLLPGPRGAVRRALVDGSKYLLAMEKAPPHEKLWYLQLLVVDPSVQRRGIGTMLQRSELARADSEGLACYLETQDPDNLSVLRPLRLRGGEGAASRQERTNRFGRCGASLRIPEPELPRAARCRPGARSVASHHGRDVGTTSRTVRGCHLPPPSMPPTAESLPGIEQIFEVLRALFRRRLNAIGSSPARSRSCARRDSSSTPRSELGVTPRGTQAAPACRFAGQPRPAEEGD